MNRRAFVASVVSAGALGAIGSPVSKQFYHDALPVETAELARVLKLEHERQALNAPAILEALRDGHLTAVYDDNQRLDQYDSRDNIGKSYTVYTEDIYGKGRWLYINYGLPEQATIREFARRVESGKPVLDLTATYNPLTSDARFDLVQPDGSTVAYSAQRFGEFEMKNTVMAINPVLRSNLLPSIADDSAVPLRSLRGYSL